MEGSKAFLEMKERDNKEAVKGSVVLSCSPTVSGSWETNNYKYGILNNRNLFLQVRLCIFYSFDKFTH